jgi:hypothetical protein
MKDRPVSLIRTPTSSFRPLNLGYIKLLQSEVPQPICLEVRNGCWHPFIFQGYDAPESCSQNSATEFTIVASDGAAKESGKKNAVTSR